MTNRNLVRLFRLCTWALGGGVLLQATSCNDEVQAAVLAGAQSTVVSIANALIAAFFEGLI